MSNCLYFNKLKYLGMLCSHIKSKTKKQPKLACWDRRAGKVYVRQYIWQERQFEEESYEEGRRE